MNEEDKEETGDIFNGIKSAKKINRLDDTLSDTEMKRERKKKKKLYFDFEERIINSKQNINIILYNYPSWEIRFQIFLE